MLINEAVPPVVEGRLVEVARPVASLRWRLVCCTWATTWVAIDCGCVNWRTIPPTDIQFTHQTLLIGRKIARMRRTVGWALKMSAARWHSIRHAAA